MANAHLCLNCGIDLARVHATREPHYGLMIVRCPECARVAVRRRHPLLAAFRYLRRLDAALTVLVLNLAALAGLTVAAVAGAVWVAQGGWRFAELRGETFLALVWIGLLLPVAIGTWLTFGLPHWPRRASWPAFLGVTLALLLISAAVIELGPWLRRFLVDPDDARKLLPGSVLELTRTTVLGTLVLVAMMAIAALGIGPGLGARWLLRQAVLGVRRWRRRRRRLERMR